MTWEEGDADAAQSSARSTCFGPASLDFGNYDEITTGDHFVIHWDPDNTVTQTRVDRLLDWFEQSYETEVTDLGFYGPNLSSSYEILVIVENLGSASVGAYTTITNCSWDYMAYIVVNSQWFADDAGLQSTAPHELFHAIQMVYAWDELFQNQGDNEWLIESTAVYQETVVFPNLLDPEVGQALRWSGEPWRSLQTADDTGFQYGLWVFHKSLERSLDTTDWHLALWQQIRERSNYDLREEIDILLQQYDSDFLREWRRFLVRGATMDFGWNNYLVGPAETENFGWGSGLGGRHEGRDLPLETQTVGDDERPEYLGASYVLIESDHVDDGEGVFVHIHLDATDGNGTVEWVSAAIGVRWEDAAIGGQELEEIEAHDFDLRPVLDEEGEVAEWYGEVVLNSFGENYDGVVLAASPVTDFGNGTVRWSYGADLVPNVQDEGFTAPAAPDEGDDDDGGSNPGGGCDLADSGKAAAAASWLLLGLLFRRSGPRRC